MPDQNGGQSPSGNSEGQSLAQHPTIDLPQQRVVGEDGAHDPQQKKNGSDKGPGKVHWINHATFWSQLGLFIIGIGALVIYYQQLQQMIGATKAAQGAAYDACMSAKIARNTLLEYQAGESDTRGAAAGTVAQAAASVRQTAAIMNIGVARRPSNEPQPLIDDPKTWKTLNVAFTYGNIGRSAAKNVQFKYTVQLLPHGTEPNPNQKGLYSDSGYAGIIQPGDLSFAGVNVVDATGHVITPTDEQMEQFRSGKLYMASFGRVDYADIFGIHHWQRFCGYQDNWPFDPSKPVLRHKGCGEYNGQDSNFIYSIPTTLQTKQATQPIDEISCPVPKP